MADKEKRLRKILVKKCLKGKLKPVGSLEDAHIVLIEDRQCINKTLLIGRDTYAGMVEEGHTFPEDNVHFMVSTNPRNMWHIERKFLTNAFASMKSVPK